MRLKDYFVGKPVVLHSPISPSVAADRINNAAGSTFWPFNFGIVGRAYFGRVSLRFRSSIFEYNAKPVLVGRIIEEPSGSVLDLNYRAPAPFYVFFIFWYAFLALITLVFVGNATGNVPAQDLAFILAVIAALFVLPLGMHYFGTRNSDEELNELLDFLEREAEATPQSVSQPPNPRHS